jgi:uncharacterized peroxidase-related enzyme
LGRLTKRTRPGLADAVVADHSTADLSDRERAMVTYVEKLTLTPWEMIEGDLEGMRDTGLTDSDILAVNLIASYFAFVNRIADGLGVDVEGRDDVIGW